MKDYLIKTNSLILPVIINGTISEIKNTIIIQDKQYLIFILSDGDDSISTAILKSDKTINKVNFIMDKYKSKEKIVIKEPRRPNIQLQNFNIDLLISEIDPSIGTELLAYSEFKWFINSQPSLKFKDLSNQKKKEKMDNEIIPKIPDFSIASDLLEKNTKKTKSEKFNQKSESTEEILNKFQLFKRNIIDINIIEEKKLKTHLFDKISYILSVDNLNKNFLAKILLFGSNSKNNKSFKILDFKIINQQTYFFIKENLPFFISIKGINQLLENLGANK